MTKLLLAIAAMTISTAALAQSTERTIVRAGEDIGPAISPNGHYRFAEFTNGLMTMKYGSKSKARFNLHLCNGEMQFIDPKGDTLAIAQVEFIDNIIVEGNTRFVFVDKVYYEIVSETAAGRLGKRVAVKVANDKKTAFGQSDPTGSQYQVSEVMFETRTVTLSYDVEVRKTTSYFWINSNNTVTPANKKNTLKLVEKVKQASLQGFVEENKTNFNNEEDLRKLLAFAATL